MKFAFAALLTALFPDNVHGSAPSCDGTLENVIVDFETDADGNPLRAGDVPTKLPGGLMITEASRNRQARIRGTGMDQLIFDTANPNPHDLDLFSETEGSVLIINKSNDRSKPNDERFGGVIRFAFTKEVFQVNSIRFLDVQKTKKKIGPSSVSGTLGDGSLFAPVNIPPAGNNEPTSVNFQSFFF